MAPWSPDDRSFRSRSARQGSTLDHHSRYPAKCRWEVVVPKIYYGWIMLFAIALMSFASSGSRFSFGVFVVPMTQELNWGRDQLALAASLNLILAGLLRPLVGILADRLGSKVIALPGVAVGGSALILTSFARELWQFYLAYGILLAIGYSFTSPVTVTTLVSQ